MKCQGCGHEFPNSLLRCPRCRRLSSKRSEGSGDSRLIEFPRRPRTSQSEPSEASLPAWRIELNEKVRARKEKQSPADEIDDAACDPAVETAAAVSAPPREPRPASIVSPDSESPLFFS